MVGPDRSRRGRGGAAGDYAVAQHLRWLGYGERPLDHARPVDAGADLVRHARHGRAGRDPPGHPADAAQLVSRRGGAGISLAGSAGRDERTAPSARFHHLAAGRATARAPARSRQRPGRVRHHPGRPDRRGFRPAVHAALGHRAHAVALGLFPRRLSRGQCAARGSKRGWRHVPSRWPAGISPAWLADRPDHADPRLARNHRARVPLRARAAGARPLFRELRFRAGRAPAPVQPGAFVPAGNPPDRGQDGGAMVDQPPHRCARRSRCGLRRSGQGARPDRQAGGRWHARLDPTARPLAHPAPGPHQQWPRELRRRGCAGAGSRSLQRGGSDHAVRSLVRRRARSHRPGARGQSVEHGACR